MSFQDEVKEGLLELLPEDQKEAFEAKLAPVFTKMDEVFAKQARDMETYKKELRDLKAAAGKAGDGGSEERIKNLMSDFEEAQKKLEEKEKAFKDLSASTGTLAKERKTYEALAKSLADKAEREAQGLTNLVKENELRRAIGVLSLKDPAAADEVFDLLSAKVQVVVEDSGARRVFAKMKGEDGVEVEAPLTDYVANWGKTSTVAKQLLAAPRTSGGGSQGAFAPGSIGGPKGLEAQYDEAIAKGDVGTAVRLKDQLARLAK